MTRKLCQHASRTSAHRKFPFLGKKDLLAPRFSHRCKRENRNGHLVFFPLFSFLPSSLASKYRPPPNMMQDVAQVTPSPRAKSKRLPSTRCKRQEPQSMRLHIPPPTPRPPQCSDSFPPHNSLEADPPSERSTKAPRRRHISNPRM